MNRMIDRLGLPVIALATLSLALTLYALNIWLGALNQDEGWYLYAALQQGIGRLPYRDFFFTQGPLMPKIYGWFAPLWAPEGVVGGRGLTALLGLLGSLTAAIVAAQALPRRRWAAIITVLLLTSGNVYHSYFTTIPKTYALTSLLLSLSLLGFWRMDKNNPLWAAWAGFFLALAASTRLSLGIALPVVGLWMLYHFRHRRWTWIAYGLGGMFALSLTLLPALLVARDQFIFANFFHTARGGGGVTFLIGSFMRLMRGYLPLVAMVFVTLALHAAFEIDAPDEPQPSSSGKTGLTACALIFASIFLVHILAPFPYDDYQVPLMPLAAVMVATLFWRILPIGENSVAERRRQRIVLSALLLWSSVGSASSTLIEDWAILGKDRLWVITKEQSDIELLRETAADIARMVKPGQLLLTQDLYLAVEAKRQVPPGFEMGPFSYFPNLDDTAAANYKVLNQTALETALVAGEAPVIALSGYGLAMEAPIMTPVPPDTLEHFERLIDEHYTLTDSIPNFGQGHTNLRIWKRK